LPLPLPVIPEITGPYLSFQNGSIGNPGIRAARTWIPAQNHSGNGKPFSTSAGPAEKGFTLVELLIVLVLIGSISAMVFIAVGSGMLKSKESRFVTNFTQGLVHARSASLVRGEVVRFVIYGPEREFFVQGKRPEHIPETIKVEGKGINEPRPGAYVIYFFPDGSSSGGEIDLKRADGSIDRVSIDRFLGIIQTTHIS
jgi:general secretion pathway protein H